MKSFQKLFATLLIAGTIFVSAQANAQDVYDFEGYKQMNSNAVTSLFSGRTFWGKKQYDRFFFGKDGSFAQQYVKAGQTYKPGSTFYGAWAVDADGSVCLTYQNGNVQPLLENECFDVYMGPDKFKALPKYTDPLYLVKKGDTSKTNVEYFWSRWMDGRLIMEPTFAAQFEDQLGYIKSIKGKFDANVYKDTPPFKSLEELPVSSQNYLKAVVGKVLFTPYHYLYFAPNGDYVFYDRGEFEAQKNNPDVLKSKAKTGRWMMYKNIHCWSLYGSNAGTTCQYVAENETLDKPFQGFMTYVDDGFPRLLNNDPVGIMSVEQTGSPAAFK